MDSHSSRHVDHVSVCNDVSNTDSMTPGSPESTHRSLGGVSQALEGVPISHLFITNGCPLDQARHIHDIQEKIQKQEQQQQQQQQHRQIPVRGSSSPSSYKSPKPPISTALRSILPKPPPSTSPISPKRVSFEPQTSPKRSKQRKRIDGHLPTHCSAEEYYSHSGHPAPMYASSGSFPSPEYVHMDEMVYDSQTEYQSDTGFHSGGDGEFQPRTIRSKIPSRPFPRKSKAGNQHFVTPSGATLGFTCTFREHDANGVCGQTFDLPSKIREHLIDEHMLFSPFQCHNCKKIFTRLSIHTRHLTKTPGSEERVCSNPQAREDENYRIRTSVKKALWDIRLKQCEVDAAVYLIMKYNGSLENRRRRGQGVSPGRSPERTGSGHAEIPHQQPSPSSYHHQPAHIIPSQLSHFPHPSSHPSPHVYTTPAQDCDPPYLGMLPLPGPLPAPRSVYDNYQSDYNHPPPQPIHHDYYAPRTSAPWESLGYIPATTLPPTSVGDYCG